MTIIKPTFSVSRFKVLKGTKEVFDCHFHNGVNIIRGRNSCGKTTIMDLLAFSIGAENIRWKPEALSCSHTVVEVKLNGVSACFKREISDKSQRPLNIYWGSLEELEKNDEKFLWEQYPFKRSKDKLSFTQIIFNALEIPNAQGDGASNLTMHQILRVLYADQPSVHSPIFRIDNFDSALTKEMVGSYLCGVHDDELYNAQLKLREVDVDLTKKIETLKSIFNVLGKSGYSEKINNVDIAISELEDKRDRLYSKLEKIKNGESRGDNTTNDQKETVNKRKALDKAKTKYNKLIDSRERLKIEIADSEIFITELKNRLNGLYQSKIARKFFRNLKFDFCPSCLEKITVGDTACCHLCKNEIKEGGGAQILRMENEILLQIRESSKIIERKKDDLENLEKDLPLEKSSLKQLEKMYISAIKTWDAPEIINIQNISKQLGETDKEINMQHENKKLFEIVNKLQEERDAAQREKEILQSLIESLSKKEELRKNEVSKYIDMVMKRLLKLDLPLQPEFIDPKEVKFDFVENAVYVNGSKYFSESSAVVLRQLFHLALLTASIHKDYMRFPRFLLLDGIDDGGMEKDRSHNLQKIIVDESKSYDKDFQIIYATSEIRPEYEESNLTVSRFFTPEKRSLGV